MLVGNRSRVESKDTVESRVESPCSWIAPAGVQSYKVKCLRDTQVLHETVYPFQTRISHRVSIDELGRLGKPAYDVLG